MTETPDIIDDINAITEETARRYQENLWLFPTAGRITPVQLETVWELVTRLSRLGSRRQVDHGVGGHRLEDEGGVGRNAIDGLSRAVGQMQTRPNSQCAFCLQY